MCDMGDCLFDGDFWFVYCFCCVIGCWINLWWIIFFVGQMDLLVDVIVGWYFLCDMLCLVYWFIIVCVVYGGGVECLGRIKIKWMIVEWLVSLVLLFGCDYFC